MRSIKLQVVEHEGKSYCIGYATGDDSDVVDTYFLANPISTFGWPLIQSEAVRDGNDLKLYGSKIKDQILTGCIADESDFGDFKKYVESSVGIKLVNKSQLISAVTEAKVSVLLEGVSEAVPELAPELEPELEPEPTPVPTPEVDASQWSVAPADSKDMDLSHLFACEIKGASFDKDFRSWHESSMKYPSQLDIAYSINQLTSFGKAFRKPVYCFAVDYDSCIASSGMKQDDVASEAEQLLGSAFAVAKERGVSIEVAVGSMRQTRTLDKSNKTHNNNGSCLSAISAIAEKHEHVGLNKLLLADVWGGNEPGTEFGSTASDSPIICVDESKVSLVYAQVHEKCVREGADTPVIYALADDRPDVLEMVRSFYCRHPDLLPENIIVFLNEREVDGDGIFGGNCPGQICAVLRGTGTVDPDYARTIKVLAGLALPSISEAKLAGQYISIDAMKDLCYRDEFYFKKALFGDKGRDVSVATVDTLAVDVAGKGLSSGEACGAGGPTVAESSTDAVLGSAGEIENPDGSAKEGGDLGSSASPFDEVLSNMPLAGKPVPPGRSVRRLLGRGSGRLGLSSTAVLSTVAEEESEAESALEL